MPIEGKTAELTQQEIWNCILGTEKRIIGVHGMGGVGKTTIMRNIHNDLSQQSESKHFDCFIWITVSNDVDVNKLQRKIAKELKIDMEEDDDENDRARKIFNALKRRKKFLLILDDMWKQFDLVEVGIPIPSEENRCKVVLTTRDKGICGPMQAHAIKVRVLSEDESWEFFKNIVGDVIVSKDMENLAKDVAKECCNLPLAIKTVVGSMCGVDNAAVWMDALKDLKEANGGFKGIDKVFTLLKFSYTRLGDPLLQYCFLFCSLYPEDYEISANELINNWIYEGLIDKRGTREDNINKGHTILDRLVKVSMLERCDNLEGAMFVKMHDLIRDMAIDITRAENPRSVIYAGRQLQDLSTEFPEDAERISLMHNDIEELSDIKSLPNSVSNLKNLRALHLDNTWELCVFPGCIIPRLSHLEELTMRDSRWKWSSKTGEDIIEEIMNSTRLAILNIQSVLSEPMVECSCVEIGGCDLIGEENQLLLPDTTQQLVISNCQISSLWHFTRLLHKNALPARLLQQLRCLKSISVWGCGQMKEIVGEEEEMGITREDDNNAMLILSQLQSLTIDLLPELKGIFSGVFICNALETITIASCPELKTLPFSVDNLPCALKEIKGEKEWWDAVEWDHPRTKAHFDSLPKMWRSWYEHIYLTQ
ncbi:putative disease resistance protein isoform X2 [Cinnamomum micranthum f. kanehirae]|uniref:Putative disease resistance protein isoform X2 n=1 Tax=Cinnamomum micranthum f. kanehirae TaxID=337451 RepID=A0A3S3N9X9_9MAGN|nr:putative disease resistance protein isoform X2 [Cinnamomum micranthum f. kanehirae]